MKNIDILLAGLVEQQGHNIFDMIYNTLFPHLIDLFLFWRKLGEFVEL